MKPCALHPPARFSPPLSIPLARESVRAGFPSPAEGQMDHALDINQHLIQRPHSTFFVRVEGVSMRDAGIFHGDLLVVDRAETPRNGAVVLAVLDGEFTVKRLRMDSGGVWLCAEHPDYPAFDVTHRNVEIWGVVTHSIRHHRPTHRPCSP